METNQPRANLLKVTKSEYIEDMFENEYIWFELHKTFRPQPKVLTDQQKNDLHLILYSGLDKKQLIEPLIEFSRKKSQEEKLKDDGIMDPREMNVTHQQGLYIEISGPGIKMRLEKGKDLKNAVRNEHYPDDHYTLISCFYFLEDSTDDPDDRYKKEFYQEGKKMLVIYEPEVFLKKIEESIINLGFDPKMKSVEYYDPATDNFPPDSLTPFHKSNEFAHQNEFRIGMRPANFGDISLPASESMRLPVPGLKELSFVKVITINSLF